MKTEKISEAIEIIVADSMIEVFVTNVNTENESSVILSKLRTRFSGLDFHVDFEDCDKVLRVEGSFFDPEDIRILLKANGFSCYVMHE